MLTDIVEVNAAVNVVRYKIYWQLSACGQCMNFDTDLIQFLQSTDQYLEYLMFLCSFVLLTYFVVVISRKELRWLSDRLYLVYVSLICSVAH